MIEKNTELLKRFLKTIHKFRQFIGLRHHKKVLFYLLIVRFLTNNLF